MRAHVPSYEIITPAKLSEALDLISSDPGRWRAFAGGTDLMVLLEAGKLPHRHYLNIWNLAELRGFAASTEYLTLGALTTYTEIQASEIVRKEFPMLCQAASETGGLAIQNAPRQPFFTAADASPGLAGSCPGGGCCCALSAGLSCFGLSAAPRAGTATSPRTTTNAAAFAIDATMTTSCFLNREP